jgi:Zn-dependent peptidase ImmA (M78 family)/DNA-binding XRE family transcriptional regulator
MRVGTLGFVAERLTEGREARGLTQASLAEMTGIKAQSLSHYEQGRQSPSPEALALLADKLGLPEHYFLRPITIHSTAPVYYRSLSPAGRAARLKAERNFGWLKEIAAWLARYIEMPRLHMPPMNASAISDRIDPAGIERIADECRAFWNLGHGPVRSVVGLMERAGLIVARLPLEPDMHGFSQWDGETPYIVLDSNGRSCARARFDAAHELGHLILHRGLGPPADQKTHNVREDQANRFAGAFLLPAQAFRREVWAPGLDTLVSLKKDWKCSVAAMICRSEQLGIFDKDQSRRAWVNLSRRGWKTEEPLDDTQQPERPESLARALQLLLEGGVKDRHTVVFELGIGVKDIENLLGLDAGYLADPAPLQSPVVRLRENVVF